MLVRVAVLAGLVTTGCGRLGFDPTSDGPPADARCPSCDQGLVAHWRFDESSGSAVVDDIGGKNGVLRPDGMWRPAEGVIGGALALDTSFVSTPFDLSTVVDTRFTVALWAKVATTSSPYDRYFSQFFFDGANNGALLMDTNLGTGARCGVHFGAWHFVMVDDVVPFDTWHHIACLYDGVAVRVFVDGAEQGMMAVTNGRVLNTSAGLATGIGASILADGTSSQNELTGLLDDIRVYDRALTPAELALLGSH